MSALDGLAAKGEVPHWPAKKNIFKGAGTEKGSWGSKIQWSHFTEEENEVQTAFAQSNHLEADIENST